MNHVTSSAAPSFPVQPHNIVESRGEKVIIESRHIKGSRTCRHQTSLVTPVLWREDSKIIYKTAWEMSVFSPQRWKTAKMCWLKGRGVGLVYGKTYRPLTAAFPSSPYVWIVMVISSNDYLKNHHLLSPYLFCHWKINRSPFSFCYSTVNGHASWMYEGRSGWLLLT